MPLRCLGLCLATLILSCAAQAADRTLPDLAQAEALLRAGEGESAWQMLESREAEFAGHPNFDYLLGLAALESGRPGRASFILERVVGSQPEHAAAHLDLARALYAQGDFERAKLEFEAAEKFNPPAAARETIRRHLDMIVRRDTSGPASAGGYVEIGVGRDSNPNSGVTGGAYYLPILGANLGSAARHARYGVVAAGIDGTLALDDGRELFGGLDVRRRHHAREMVDTGVTTDYYDTRSVDGRVGVQQKLGTSHALRLTAAQARQTLNDDETYRRTQSLLAEWRVAIDSRTQGSLWLTDQRHRFGTVSDTDFRQYGGNQLLAGVGLVHAFGSDNRVIAHVTAFAGKERLTDADYGNLDGDKRLASLRVGGLLRLLPELDLTASAGGAFSHYAQTNPLFFGTRREQLWDASLGVQWRFAPAWSLRPQYAYIRNDANFGAYDFARHDYSLVLRRDFR